MLRQYRLLIVTLSISLFGGVIWLEAGTRVAVMDLGAKNKEAGEIASVLTDVLRAEIYKAEVFELMNREDMKAILGEVALQQSGVCESTSCIVEMGNALGLEKMIAGNIGKIGKRWSVTLKLVGIESAANELLITEFYDGKVEKMPEFVQEQALKIIEREEELAGPQAEADGGKKRSKFKRKAKEPKRHSAVKAGLYGLIPGAGQLYNGQKKKAVVFGALGVTAAVLTFTSKSATEDARTAYQDAKEDADFQTLFDDAESKQSTNQMFFLATVGVVTFSVVDSWWYGRKKAATEVSLAPLKDGVVVAYGIKF